jgi:1-deoxy-D-xylulose-5-phosphate synthase
MSPRDSEEFKGMLTLALEHDGPIAIRYPRGYVQVPQEKYSMPVHFKIGEAEIMREGKDVAFLALGNMVYPAMNVARRLEDEGIEALVVNARFVKPLDRTLISSVASLVPRIITLEENILQGGFGSMVLEFLNSIDIPPIRVKRLGIPDRFIEQGSQNELRSIYGLDEESIYTAAKSILKEQIYSS